MRDPSSALQYRSETLQVPDLENTSARSARAISSSASSMVTVIGFSISTWWRRHRASEASRWWTSAGAAMISASAASSNAAKASAGAPPASRPTAAARAVSGLNKPASCARPARGDLHRVKAAEMPGARSSRPAIKRDDQPLAAERRQVEQDRHGRISCRWGRFADLNAEIEPNSFNALALVRRLQPRCHAIPRRRTDMLLGALGIEAVSGLYQAVKGQSGSQDAAPFPDHRDRTGSVDRPATTGW